MFGYIKVQKEDLLVKEYEAYKSVYCGLCRQMGKDYSFLSRFTLSYDCTFYAMFLMAKYRSCSGFEKKRCCCNPLKKCTYCKTDSEHFSKAAAFSIISVYYKLIDDINDSKFFKRILLHVLRPFFSNWRKKASKKYPELDELVKLMMNEQSEAEHNENCHLDMACDATAKMLGNVLKLEAQNSAEERILYQMGYGLGRFIYLADAADDLEKDINNNNFNPFISYKENKYEVVKNNLSQALAYAFDAYNFLELVDFKGIIDNVLIKGLPIVQQEILKKI